MPLQVNLAPVSYELLIDLMLRAALHVLEHLLTPSPSYSLTHSLTHSLPPSLPPSLQCVMTECLSTLWMTIYLFSKLSAVLRGHAKWPAFVSRVPLHVSLVISCDVDS